jgi:hypothetical protein
VSNIRLVVDDQDAHDSTGLGTDSLRPSIVVIPGSGSKTTDRFYPPSRPVRIALPFQFCYRLDRHWETRVDTFGCSGRAALPRALTHVGDEHHGELLAYPGSSGAISSRAGRRDEATASLGAARGRKRGRSSYSSHHARRETSCIATSVLFARRETSCVTVSVRLTLGGPTIRMSCDDCLRGC